MSKNQEKILDDDFLNINLLSDAQLIDVFHTKIRYPKYVFQAVENELAKRKIIPSESWASTPESYSSTSSRWKVGFDFLKKNKIAVTFLMLLSLGSTLLTFPVVIFSILWAVKK